MATFFIFVAIVALCAADALTAHPHHIDHETHCACPDCVRLLYLKRK